MAGRKAGDVWVAIHPDAALFGTQAREQVKRAVAGIRVDVPVTADTKPAIAQVEALKTRMSLLNDKLAKLRLTADGKDAEATIARVQAKMAVLAKTVAKLTMTADTKKLDAQILAKIADLKKLQQGLSGLKMDADDKALTAKILALERRAAGLKKSLDKGTIKGDINIAAAQAKLESLNADIVLLRHNAKDITLVASNVAALRNIAVLRAEIASLQKEARDIRLGGGTPDVAGLMAAEAALLGLEAAFGKASEESALAKTAMNAFFATSGRGSTFAAAGWKLLTGHITLFGGILNRVLPRMFTSVAVWHLLADAVIELVAVWAPAILAVTAFGVAGADAAKSIFQRMQAVHTVMDATGKAVPPLSRNFENLAKAVKPEVYQLFGDALVIMGKRGGAFNTIAVETGRVIDQLAARFTAAVTSGTGVNKFMENAVTDVRLLGDSIGNLGGIFGAVFKAVPGYAEILLQVGDAITKVLESAAQAAEPVIAVGLFLHGAAIYGGAAVTVFLALVAGLVKMSTAFGKFNDKVLLVGLGNLKKFGSGMKTAGLAIAEYAGELLTLSGSAGKAAAGTKLLADAQRLLTKIPTTVWVLAAATALASLVFAIVRSKDAAQKFNATLQETITNAPLASVVTTIQQAQVVTAARLADSTRKLNTAIKENTVVNAGRAGALNSNGTAIQNLDNASRHYAEGLGQLTEQQKLVTGRFGDLSKSYGGNTAALGLLNAAGITTAQITDTNKDHWAQALIQVEATAKAYAAMGTQAGVLGNDLDVLGRTVTDQAQAVKKLNDAWSQFIGDVTGTQGAFDTVAQGFFTLNDHAGKLTFSLGKLKVKYSDASAAIDSLTPAGIALNQAFGEQVVNIDKLFASWRTAGLAGNLFTAGVKDAIGPLVKYARGSQEATAQLVALAQEAGYQGPISMQALTKWLGNTHGATKKLKDITNQATEQEALLTGAMQNQGNFISSKLLGDINSAVMAYSGVEGAVRAYGTALAKSGKGSDAANKAMTKAVGALVQSGVAMGTNAQQLAAIVSKTFGVSMPAAMKLVQQAMRDMVAGLPPAQKKFELFAITGLGRTREQADKLWKKFSETNLGALAAKADTTRDKFDKLASKGLGITRDQADQLWKHLRLQYLDELGRKGDITRGKFIQLAEKGLDLTRNAAQKLWDTLHRQQLTDAASKAGATRQSMEKLAGQLGVTKGYVDRLWDSMNKLKSKNITIVMVGDASYKIKDLGTGTTQAIGTHTAAGRGATGMYISGGTGPTADDVPIWASRGEFVTRASSVSKYGVDAMNAVNKGQAVISYAAGGAVPKLAGARGYASGGLIYEQNAPIPKLYPFAADLERTTRNAMQAETVRLMTKALKAAEAAAAAAGSSVPGGGGGAARWKTQILTALAMLNQPGSLLGAVEHRMNQESGGNQFAVNKSDSNWLAGTPSVGVMQVIGPTYRSNSPVGWRNLPPMAYGVSEDVLANTYAGLHHAIFDYRGRSLASVVMQPGGYALGGMVPGMAAGGATQGTHQVTGLATGGTIAQQGRKYLDAWKTRHGGGFGAAWSPIVLNQQIAAMAAAASRATTLSKAGGLSAGQHKFWANAAADEKKRLAVLRKELGIERSWRYQLELQELGLSKQIRAAGNIRSLAGPVKGWKSQLAHDKSVVAQISKMLGYSDAFIKAHPVAKPGAKPPGPAVSPVPVAHTYGGDVPLFDAIAPVLAAAMAPFAKGGLAGFTRGGMASFDRGGVLSPGANTVWNGTGRDEKLVPAGSNITVTLEIAPGGNTAFEQLLHSAIRKHVRIRGGGSVQRAYSVPGTVSGANTWRSG